MKLSEILRERGYIHQHTGELEEITESPRTLYWGVDPSADSMHVGQLMGVLIVRRFLEAGHKVIVIMGGGTGMIGDPGGRSEERNLLTDDAVAHNTEALRKQFAKLFKGAEFEMINNATWLRALNLMEFLRDTGKHFTVNEMIKRDSVRPRIETADQSISFTEFSYMLLQAYDYLYLNEKHGCTLQVGASDQWGNIVSGVDLIRRKSTGEAHAFCWPLLINKSTGKKFGKSEGGAVWLDQNKTSVFDFYQFWFNTNDQDVEEYLLKMTLLSKKDIDTVMQEQKADPSSRSAQKNLAFEVTALVHGEDEARKAAESSEALFSGKGSITTDIPTVAAHAGSLLWEVVKEGLGISRSEFVRLVASGAVRKTDAEAGEIKIVNANAPVEPGEVFRIGKNKFIRIK